jgi:hypothetical protein
MNSETERTEYIDLSEPNFDRARERWMKLHGSSVDVSGTGFEIEENGFSFSFHFDDSYPDLTLIISLENEEMAFQLIFILAGKVPIDPNRFIVELFEADPDGMGGVEDEEKIWMLRNDNYIRECYQHLIEAFAPAERSELPALATYDF